MSDNNDKKVPLEYPAIQQPKKIDPIVDVVENEVFPPFDSDVQNIRTKSQQE